MFNVNALFKFMHLLDNTATKLGATHEHRGTALKWHPALRGPAPCMLVTLFVAFLESLLLKNPHHVNITHHAAVKRSGPAMCSSSASTPL